MNNKTIARKYIEFLEKGDLNGINRLFHKDGMVESPLYGKMRASEFYKELMSDTTKSQLEIKGIYETPESNSIALFFNYKWTMKNNEIADFDVVDIIDFNNTSEIRNLKIIARVCRFDWRFLLPLRRRAMF